jgi:hypothetical protein
MVLPHITARVFINDDEHGLHHDYRVWLEKLATHAPIDKGDPEAGCTSAAQTGCTVQIMGRDAQRWWRWPMADSTLARGSGSFKARRTGWPGSLDGRRRKRVLVEIIGE